MTRFDHILKAALKHAILHLVRVHPARILRLLVPDLDRLDAPPRTRGIGLQLRIDAAVHRAEQIRRAIHALRHCQDAVVLQDDGFILAEGLGDAAALFVREHDPAEGVVDGVVVVEAAGVLVDGLELAAEGAEGLRRQAVAVHGGDDVGPGLVYRDVDAEAGRVDGVHVAFAVLGLDGDALFVDEAEVVRPEVREGFAERVDPEVVGEDGVADGDVAAGAFVIVPVEAEPAEGGCRVEFTEGAFRFEVCEAWDADLGHRCGLVAGNGVWTVDEAVEGAVSRELLDLLGALVACEGVGGCRVDGRLNS